MITRLEGWSWSVSGDAVALVHPKIGTIRYRERLAPLRSLRTLLDEQAPPPGITQDAPEVSRIVTDDGEYGALVVSIGNRDNQRMCRVLAIVFGDDWYSELVGVSLDPEQFDALSETVEKLARRDRLLLGHPRRRRFNYAAPTGWSSYEPLPLTACWFPPGYPRDSQLITVYPALPHHNDQRIELEALPVGPPLPAMVIDEAAEPIDLVHGPLIGRQWAFHIHNERGDLVRLVAMLRSAFHYYCILGDATEATLPALTEQFTKLRESIEPLPAPRVAISDVFDHWV